MGKSKDGGDTIAMVLCIIGFLLLAQQGSVLSRNTHDLKLKEKELVTRAVPSLSQSFCDLTREELNSLSTPSSSTPILNFLGDSLTASLPVLSQHLSGEFIEQVVQHAGFFPSNLLQTAQDLLEYNSGVMAFSVSQLTDGLGSSYYYYYNQAIYEPYLYIGNYMEVVSQVFGLVAQVTPLSPSSVIPEQDSWVGNLFVSLPNITYQTADNTTSWTAGFTSMSTFFRTLGQQEWKGSYWSDNDPDNYRVNWECSGCDHVLNNIANQAQILAAGPSFQKQNEETSEELRPEGPLELRPAGTQ